MRYTFVYFIVAPDSRKVKVGITENISSRLSTIRGSSPEVGLYLSGFIRLDGYSAGIVEKRLHKILASYRSHGEWFTFNPWVESYIENVIMNSAMPGEENTSLFNFQQLT
jgi:T5orf172 domain